MAGKYRINIETMEDLPIEDFLAELDFLHRGTVLARALRKAGNIVKENAIPRIPRSSFTKTAKKKSKKQQAADSRRKPLADSIDIKVKPYQDGKVFVALVGPAKEQGRVGNVAHAHLVELGHRGYYWSKEQSSRKPFVEAKRWLAPAVDATQSMQWDAIFGELKRAAVAAARKKARKTKIK